MLKLLVIGAASAIAQETARLFAADGASMFLVDLRAGPLEAVRDDLKARGAKQVETFVLDLTDVERHQAMLDAAIETLDGLDAVLIAHGTLSDQEACQQDVQLTLRELDINFVSVVALLTLLGNYFEEKRNGVVAVISSVAGDRGRRSNYVYGTAKAGVTTFLSGLRARLSDAGVKVITIKPGQVDTPMTAHLKKGITFSKPDRVGKAIYNGMKKGREVMYVPWFWLPIMLIIIHMPEFIFKKMKF